MFYEAKITMLLSMAIVAVFVLFAGTKIMAGTEIVAEPGFFITDQRIECSDGTVFILQKEGECLIPVSCQRPKDKDDNCQEIPLSKLLSTSDGKAVVDFWTPGNACHVVIIQDDSEDSTYYCVGKRCYY
jgi:hypothetical protein